MCTVCTGSGMQICPRARIWQCERCFGNLHPISNLLLLSRFGSFGFKKVDAGCVAYFVRNYCLTLNTNILSEEAQSFVSQ